ncbi:MAG: hypothetical protein MZU97_10330 [Bacillus subtilis]|nr:hypothetical protein [Bacillus subtilis]
MILAFVFDALRLRNRQAEVADDSDRADRSDSVGSRSSYQYYRQASATDRPITLPATS